MVQPLWKWYGDPQNIKELPYDPAIPLLDIYLKELKAGSQRNICTPMFVAALITIAKGENSLSVH